MRELVMRTHSAWLLILGPMVFVMGLGPWLEAKYSPVVDPFVVLASETSNGNLVISGWMDKRREYCRVKELYAVLTEGTGMPSVADIQFGERAGKALVSRPRGKQKWGPWSIPVTPEVTTVTIRARHQCHLLWDMVSEFTVYRRG